MRLLAIAVALSACCATASAQTARLDVAGVWLTEARDGRIEIADCGDGTPCGRIVGGGDGVTAERFDTANPNPALRSRSLMNLRILSNYRRDGQRWVDGRIYEPDTGRTYGSRLHLGEDGTLRVQGCLGPICQTQRWTRVR